ncbi:MAG: glutaredoxin domain-containing protein, partial [Solibacillus sp.]
MLVTLFTSPSCTSCRKAKAWLEEHDISYTERNIFSEPLTISEIKEILSKSSTSVALRISAIVALFELMNLGTQAGL